MPKMEFVNIEDQYKKHPELKRPDVLALLEWYSMQPHLPKISELEAAIILHSCYGSNEAAKKRIDNYAICHTYCPEYFTNCDPTSDELQLSMDTVAVCVLPKLTAKNEIIFYTCLLNTNPDVYNYNAVIKTFTLVINQYVYQNGCCNGHIFVVDVRGTQLMHLLKIHVLSLKKTVYYLQDAAPLRPTGIHFVNGVPFMDKILALVKPFMKKELQQQMHVHFGSNETLLQFIPKDCLPNECGGDCGSIRDLFAIQRKHIEDNKSFFIKLEKEQVVDESKRPKKIKNAGDFFGMEGTFKKLEID